MAPSLDVDYVVAENVRYWRNRRELTQAQLAALLSIRGEKAGEQRVMQIEGKRSRRDPHITWKLLVALAQALNVTIFDLVLPRDAGATVAASAITMPEETVTFPSHLFPAVVEMDLMRAQSEPVYWDRDEMARQLFWIPGDRLTQEGLAEARHHSDVASLREIQEKLTDIAAALEKKDDD